MKRRRFLLGTMAAVSALSVPPALLVPTAGLANAPAAVTAPIPPDAAEDLQSIEAFFNALTTMRARFVQVAPNGGHTAGTLQLKRPRYLRFDYDPPVRDYVVVTGNWVVHWDAAIQSPTHIPVSSTPLAFLLRDPIRLQGGGVRVRGVVRDRAEIRVTLVSSEEPGAGSVTLLFGREPLTLKQWSVTDARGQVTNVAFRDAEFGIEIPDRVFEFRDPRHMGPG